MRRRYPALIEVVIIAACVILVSFRTAGAGDVLSRGVSNRIFYLTAYDVTSRPIHTGQGVVVDSQGTALVSLATLEGSTHAVATMMDGSTLSVNEVHAVDEVSGLATISLSAGAPEFSERLTESGIPKAGERVIFSGRTVRSDQVCMECIITSVKTVPAFKDLYYVEASQQVPQPGGGIFGSDGRLVGIVIVRFGAGRSGLVATNERLSALAAQRVSKITLDLWSDRRADKWSNTASTRYMRGLAALWQGQPNLTVDLLKDHAGTYPSLQSNIAALLGEAYLAMNLLPEAILALNCAIDPVTPSAHIYRKLAWAYMESGQYILSEKLCQEAIQIDPGCISGYNLLARLRNLQGVYGLAVYEARRALEKNPDCPCAHFEMGRAHLGLARYGAAIKSLKSATTLDPDFGEAFNSLGYAYLRNGEPLRAVVVLKEAVKLEPERSAAWDNLGEAYIRAGLVDKALPALRQAVCLDPGRSHSYCRLAKELMDHGHYSDAADMLRQGMVQCEESQWLVYFLGKSFFLEGRVGLAREQAELLFSKNRKLAAHLLRIIETGLIS